MSPVCLLERIAKSEYPECTESWVLSMEDGAQPETSWLLLDGISYDRKNDLIEVLVEGLDHLVLHPQEIYADELGEEVLSLKVVRKDGTKEIIELR